MPLQLFHSAGEIAQSCRIALEKRCFVGGNAMWDQGDKPSSCMVANKIGHCLPFNISYIAALTVNEVIHSPLGSIHLFSYFCKTRPDWSFEDKFEVIAAIIIRNE